MNDNTLLTTKVTDAIRTIIRFVVNGSLLDDIIIGAFVLVAIGCPVLVLLSFVVVASIVGGAPVAVLGGRVFEAVDIIVDDVDVLLAIIVDLISFARSHVVPNAICFCMSSNCSPWSSGQYV